MKCQNCRFEFCWHCMQSIRNHSDFFCQSSVAYSCEVIFIMIIGLLVRLSWISIIFKYILLFILIKILTLLLGFILVFVILNTCARTYDLMLGRNYPKIDKIFILLAILTSITICISFFYFPYFYMKIFEIVLSLGLSFGICFISIYALICD